jgi:GxxExxY protein
MDQNLSKAGTASKASKVGAESSSGRKPLFVESPLSPQLEQLVYDLIGLGMEVHSAFGPGLREGVYEDADVIALENRGLSYVRQVPFEMKYQGRSVRPIRLDLVVEQKVIVELKAVTQFHDIHPAQMLTYLKLTDLPVGILMNFNVRHLKDGIRRFVRR